MQDHIVNTEMPVVEPYKFAPNLISHRIVHGMDEDDEEVDAGNDHDSVLFEFANR